MRSRQAIPALLVVAFSLTLPRSATAVDGVIEINQARALAGSVTAGDAQGFPVTIDSGGSYRLTGNLSVTGTNGIEVLPTTNGLAVTLDLNGFSITSTEPCTCTGIRVNGQTRVSNGSVRGFMHGVSGPGELWIASTYLAGTGNGYGIDSSGHAEITDSVLEWFASGISVVGVGSLVRGCTTRNNSERGITSGANSLVSGNTVSGSRYAIDVLEGSTVIGNTVYANEIGIVVTSGATLLENNVRANSGYGIFFSGSSSGYARNVLTGNNAGDANPQVTPGGIEIGSNICGTDTVCP